MHGKEQPLWLIDSHVWDSVACHGQIDYPNEACGILLSPSERRNEITRACRVANASEQRLRDRYCLDPSDYLRVLELGEREGLDICGFYHSHPDQTSSPSSYDLERAWCGYVYLILEIRRGSFASARAWSIGEEGGCFREEPFHVRERKVEQAISGVKR